MIYDINLLDTLIVWQNKQLLNEEILLTKRYMYMFLIYKAATSKESGNIK